MAVLLKAAKSHNLDLEERLKASQQSYNELEKSKFQVSKQYSQKCEAVEALELELLVGYSPFLPSYHYFEPCFPSLSFPPAYLLTYLLTYLLLNYLPSSSFDS